MVTFNYRIVFGFFVLCMPLKGMENFVARVKTTDKKIVLLPQLVLESSAVLYAQQMKKEKKKIKKILIFAPVDKVSLDLFKNGIMSLNSSVIDFKNYYEKVEEDGSLHQLISVAGALRSCQLTASLVHHYFPSEVSEYIASFVKQSAIDALRYKIIEKSCKSGFKDVKLDDVNIAEQMITCDCSGELDSPHLYFNKSKSVFVEVDSFDRMSLAVHCKRSGRSLSLFGHGSPISSVYFSSNGDLLLTCSYNDINNQHRMILWDMANFEHNGVVRKIKLINGYYYIRRVLFSPSGDLFVVALENGIFRIYSGVSGENIKYKCVYNRVGAQLKGSSCPGIFFCCDGRLLVVLNFGAQPSCSIWNPYEGKRLFLSGFNNKFRPFSAGYVCPDGHIITTGINELLGNECIDLCGHENREIINRVVNVMKSDMLSVFSFWRWITSDKKSNSLSDDSSPLKSLIAYCSEFLS